jgi:cytochrome c biogenesis protein CcdA
MEATLTISSQQVPTKPESSGGCLSIVVRLTWIFGASLLVFGAIFIMQGNAPGLADMIFWLIAFALILARYVDIKYLKGETADNKPATLKHWRRYSVILLIAAGLLYLLAKILAPLNLL